MVIYEAAHAIVNMKRTTSRELAPAVSVLQLFCSSPKPTLRFAAVRTLNKVAMTHPAAVTACNLDLENLITGTGTGHKTTLQYTGICIIRLANLNEQKIWIRIRRRDLAKSNQT